MIQLYMPLNFLGMVYREIKQALDRHGAHVRAARARSRRSPTGPARKPLARHAAARSRFEHVDFAYERERADPARTSRSTVPAGKMVAIVGPSGAGKSTLARLLFRFYDVDGRRDHDRRPGHPRRHAGGLRAAIGIVPQDTVLFNDTIYYNIEYGRPDATRRGGRTRRRGWRRSTTSSRALPEGYDTMVGERGLKLSGGEKQRVAIARTILKGPPILIFDEATSALDSHTEKEIQDALDRVAQDRTTLVIAHRLSTIVHADDDPGARSTAASSSRARTPNSSPKAALYASLWARQRQAEKAREELAHALEEVERVEALRPDEIRLVARK